MIEREIVIKAPQAKVFDVIRNFEAYPEFLKTTHSASERQSGGKVLVDFSIEVIKPVQYTLEFFIDAPNEVRWSFVKGDLMKKNDGGWKLEKISEHETRAIYSIDISFGWMVPKMIVEQVTKTQLPEMLEAFKKRAEGSS